jgi:hypothetical protein
MPSGFDVVLFFHGTNPCLTENYINLNFQLNKAGISAFTIFHGGGEWSASGPTIKKCLEKEPELAKNIHLSSGGTESLNLLSDLDYKIGVTNGYFYKMTHFFAHLPLMSQKASRLIQIADHAMDFKGFEFATDFFVIPSFFDSIPQMRDLKALSKSWKINFTHTGFFNWERIDCLHPNALTKSKFCEKYNLNKDEPILGWGPSSVPRLGGSEGHFDAREMYSFVTRLPNVITKLHPAEYRRRKSFKLGGKFSFEIFGPEGCICLDPEDHHWWLEYCDVIISYNSSIHWNAQQYNTPVIYIEPKEKGPLAPISSLLDASLFKYVGEKCPLDSLEDCLEKEKYKREDSEFEETKKEILSGLNSPFFYNNFVKNIKEML